MKWTKEILEKLKILYPITESHEELQSQFSFATWRAIQAQAAILGLRKPRLKQFPSCVNDMFFSAWNERSAYILGYLEADGYFDNRNKSLGVTFCASIKDKEYIELLADIVGYNKELFIRKHKLNNNKVYQTIGFIASSRQWKKDLEGKYRTGNIPSCIKDNLLSHYIRGYFDGDGSVYKQGTRIYASFVFGIEEFATNLLNLLLKVIGDSKGTKLKIKSNSNKCWYFRISTKDQIEKFQYYLYNNSQVYLNRKYKSFKS